VDYIQALLPQRCVLSRIYYSIRRCNQAFGIVLLSVQRRRLLATWSNRTGRVPYTRHTLS
jgi:hypothetical protein